MVSKNTSSFKSSTHLLLLLTSWWKGLFEMIEWWHLLLAFPCSRLVPRIRTTIWPIKEHEQEPDKIQAIWMDRIVATHIMQSLQSKVVECKICKQSAPTWAPKSHTSWLTFFHPLLNLELPAAFCRPWESSIDITEIDQDDLCELTIVPNHPLDHYYDRYYSQD